MAPARYQHRMCESCGIMTVDELFAKHFAPQFARPPALHLPKCNVIAACGQNRLSNRLSSESESLRYARSHAHAVQNWTLMQKTRRSRDGATAIIPPHRRWHLATASQSATLLDAWQVLIPKTPIDNSPRQPAPPIYPSTRLFSNPHTFCSAPKSSLVSNDLSENTHDARFAADFPHQVLLGNLSELPPSRRRGNRRAENIPALSRL
jgi:hypothetical protein